MQKEKPKVLIDIDEYNELIEFKKKMCGDENTMFFNKGKYIFNLEGKSIYVDSENFVSNDEAVNKIAEINSEIIKANLSLSEKNNNLFNQFKDMFDKKFIKNLSILEFIRLRRQIELDS